MLPRKESLFFLLVFQSKLWELVENILKLSTEIGDPVSTICFSIELHVYAVLIATN